MKHTLEAARKTLVASIPTDILSTNVESLRQALVPLVQPAADDRSGGGWDTLELNLVACRMIDSAGLNLIVSLLRQCTRRGARLRLIVASSHIHRILQFTRLDKHVEVVREGAN